jgi:Raf kinase inhibitor-like YbhB/YbcL family protein
MISTNCSSTGWLPTAPAKAGPVGVAEDRQRRGQREEGEDLHEQAADEKVQQVFAPLVAEDRLLAAPQQALDGDEDDAHEDQVEQEPVEPQVDVARQAEAVLRLRAAQRGSRQNAPQGDEPQHFVLPQDDAHGAQQEGGDQRQVQGQADQADVVKGARLGHGEQTGVAQTQDGPQAQRRQRQRQHAADPAGAEATLRGRGLQDVAKNGRRCNLTVTTVAENPEGPPGGPRMNLEVTSTAFQEGLTIPRQCTADGRNVSPALKWRDPPPTTKSFALVCEDPDAPRGTWTHWVAFNIPAELRELSEGVPPEGTLANGMVQGSNDFGKIGYGGPSPPPGKPHRYFFKLFALDTRLDLQPSATRAQLLQAIQGHILVEGQLMGKYGR